MAIQNFLQWPELEMPHRILVIPSKSLHISSGYPKKDYDLV